jgi:uncharacterized protein
MQPHPAQIATQHWVDRLIIGYGICPFARRQGTRYRVLESADFESALHDLADELLFLDRNPEIQTTLMIFADSLGEFDDYLDALEAAEQLLSALGYAGVYQLASFHPRYCFDGADEDDAANYSNRSPFPVWHIIREAAISAALQHYPNPEQIPQRNIELLRSWGRDKARALLAASYAAAGLAHLESE